ncbi:hypothetical protein [Mycetocola zhujimingii]|uniref:Uncharacterized protein n=1 Tax=Mycetocola zhujimingii TaxID=2079792 RepID=A0A2U1TCM3_9MICO|nr:hypothetical protein [Mycetocola zhujimingii]PWC06626.1 hypothetical protein DF223_10175 [Mycetocola zhujimingii]
MRTDSALRPDPVVPLDVDDLAAAAEGEVEEVPLRRSSVQAAIASVISAVVVVALLLVVVQWVEAAATDAANGTECRGPDCVEVQLGDLAIPAATALPAGTTVVASNRFAKLDEQFVYFEVRMPPDSALPAFPQPWVGVSDSGDDENRNARRMLGRGYTDVFWSGDYAAGTDDDGSILIIGQYQTGD